MGSDEHFDLTAFEFFQKVPSPPIAADKQPKFYAISGSNVHQLSH
jgi:hypothetical protein